MKRTHKRQTIVAILVMSMGIMAACQNSQVETKLEFSFNASEVSSEYDEKTIYIDENQEKVQLDTSLDMDCGEVMIQIVSVEDKVVVWENTYVESNDFAIELNALKANSEYTIKIQTSNTKKVDITMTSTQDLVKDKDKPEK